MTAARPRKERLLVEKQRRARTRSLRRFGEDAWPIVDPDVFIGAWYVDAICEHVQAVFEGQIRQLLVNIPPGMGKSKWVSVLMPAWVWTFDASHRFLTTSYSDELAVRDCVLSRRLIDSDWYQQQWPHVTFTRDENLKSHYVNESLGHRYTCATGSGTTGHRADTVTCDDPHNVTDTYSESKRQRVLDWWTQSVTTRSNKSLRDARRIVVCQRVHHGDLSGLLLEEGGWEHLMLPAGFEQERKCTTVIGFTDPRTEEGEALCRQLKDEDDIAETAKKLGSYGASAQLQQRPSPKGGGRFKRAHWKRLPRAEFPRMEIVIQAWDLSFTDNKQAAFTSGFVLGRYQADFYGLAAWRRRANIIAQMEGVKDLKRRCPETSGIYIECAANAHALHALLERKVPGLILVTVTEGKLARAMAWQPLQEAGNCYLPEGEQWAEDLIEECATFPVGTYRDQVDSWGLGMSKLAVADWGCAAG